MKSMKNSLKPVLLAAAIALLLCACSERGISFGVTSSAAEPSATASAAVKNSSAAESQTAETKPEEAPKESTAAETKPEESAKESTAAETKPEEAPKESTAAETKPEESLQESRAETLRIGTEEPELMLSAGEERSLFYTVSGPAEHPVLSFASLDTAVVKVDQNGKLTGVAPGSTRILAACGGVSCEWTVTVYESTAIRLEKESLALKTGEKAELTFYVTGGYPGAEPSFSFSSSDPKVVTVDENGMLTAVGEGEARVTVSGGGAAAICRVTVKTPLLADGLYVCRNSEYDFSQGLINHVFFREDGSFRIDGTLYLAESFEATRMLAFTALELEVAEDCRVDVLWSVQEYVYSYSEWLASPQYSPSIESWCMTKLEIRDGRVASVMFSS